MGTVFVLSFHAMMDGDEYSKVEVFSTREKAMDRMRVLYAEEVGVFEARFTEKEIVKYSTRCSATVFEEYHYDKNHSVFEITEQEVL